MKIPTSLPATLQVLSRGQLVLRLLVMLGPVVAVLAAGPAGDGPPWWYVVLVVLMSAGFAAFPESQVGVAVNFAVLAWWAIGPGDRLHPAVMVAAAGLVGAHVAALLTTYGPSAMPVDGAVVRLWLRRGLVVLAAAPVVWGLARLLEGATERPHLWVLGVVACALGAVVASSSLGDGEPEEQP